MITISIFIKLKISLFLLMSDSLRNDKYKYRNEMKIVGYGIKTF